MGKSRYTEAQVIPALKQVEAGRTSGEVEVTDHRIIFAFYSTGKMLTK